MLSVPDGGAPEEIRTQWVGLPLPVRRGRAVEAPSVVIGRDVLSRRLRFIRDGVIVERHDADRVLRMYGKSQAADWWAATGPSKALVFRVHEGRLLPPSLAVRLWPELEYFEEGEA